MFFTRRKINWIAFCGLFGNTLSALASIPSTTYAGKRYIYLNSIARLYGMSASTSGKAITYRNKWNSITFRTNSREADINGVHLWLHEPVRSLHGNWAIEEIDFKKTIDAVLRSSLYLKGRGRKVVVLDPGHGGKDSGAIGKRNVQEKLVVLDIARRVEAHLKRAGVRVYKTRSSDKWVGHSERTRYARSCRADLFVSIHINAATPSVSGVETFVLTAHGKDSTNSYGQKNSYTSRYPGNLYDSASMHLAHRIQKNLVARTRANDRGVKKARFKVLREMPCPGALVECGFVSNAKEEAKFIDKNYRETCACAIATGILQHFGSVKSAN